MIRSILSYLDRNPFFDALVQAVLTALISFSPILVLAWLHAEIDEDGNNLWTIELAKYFESGELVLPIFSIIGAMLYLTITKFGRLGGLISFITFIVIFLPLITCAIILGDNPGFQQILDQRVRNLLWGIYIFVNVAWIVMVWQSTKSPPPTRPGPQDEQVEAKRLASEARGAQNG